jgi:radical SAM protein with 4Fe4S-binding SPASM domain
MKLYPTRVQIETINYCNASCWFCPIKDLKRDRMKMSSSTFSNIIDQLTNHPPEIVYPFLNGEPFLDNRMITFLQEINEKLPHTEIIIFTNGSLLNESLSKQLLKIYNLHQIWFSLNGINEDYKHIMGLEYSNTEANIQTFLKLRDSVAHPEIVNISVVGKTLEETRKIYDKLRNYPIKFPVKILSSRVKNFAGLILNHPDTSIRIDSPCARIRDYLTILANGDTALCCMDPEGKINFGNILDMSIEDIWNSEKRLHYLNMHNEHRWKELELCKDCTGA